MLLTVRPYIIVIGIVLLIVLLLIILSAFSKGSTKSVNKAKSQSTPNADNYEHTLYPFAKNGTWGYMDRTGKVIIPPSFSQAEDFSEGLAAVAKKATDSESQRNYLFGFIDTTGKVIINFRFEKVYPFAEGLAIVVTGGLYGFINKNGEEIIPAQFEEAASFSEGLAVVKKNGKNGFIDKTGKMVIQPQYQRACWVSSFSEGLALVYNDADLGGYIDRTGKQVIQTLFTYGSAFSEGLALVQQEGHRQYGYINKLGEMVIKPQFEMSLPFTEGIASVKITTAGRTFFRLIDKSGKTIADNLNYRFVGIFREGVAGIETANYQWGFIDKKGKIVIPPTFASIRLFNNGLSLVQTGHLFTQLDNAYMDRTGHFIVPK